MCGSGGGDGGAEAARRAEAENLASIADARRTLASLYGAGYDYNYLDDGSYAGPELGYYGLDPEGNYVGYEPGTTLEKSPWSTYGSDEGLYQTSYDESGMPEYTGDTSGFFKGMMPQLVDARNEAYYSGLPEGLTPQQASELGPYDENLTYAAYTPERDLDLMMQYDPEAASEGYKNFLAREQRYGDMRQSVLNELIENPISGMDELRNKAYRDIRADMIRRGMVGGSADVSSRGQVNTRYGEGISDINKRADLAVQGARADDYDRYLRAVRAAEGTGDLQSGLDVMKGDQSLYVNQWQNEALAKDYSNWFRDIMDMYNLAQYRSGQQQGIDQYGNAFSPGAAQSGKSGRIY